MKPSIAIFLLLLIFQPARAQYMTFKRAQQKYFNLQHRSNFTVNQGNGISSLLIASDLKNVNRPGFTTHLDVGYTFLWSYAGGFHTGLGIQYAGSAFASDGVESQTMGYMTAYSNEQSATRHAHYTANTSSVREDYHAWYLTLPVQLAYQQDHFWMNYGVKIMLPLSFSAKYDYGVTTIGAGYDFDGFGTSVDVPVEVDRLDTRSGTYDIASLTGGINGYPAYAALALSGGYRLALDHQHTLLFGFYLDLALNRTHAGGANNMVTLGTNYACRNALQSNVVRSLRHIDCGISMTYSLTFGKKIGYHSKSRNRNQNPFKTTKNSSIRKTAIKW